jgi:hypothetical protein
VSFHQPGNRVLDQQVRLSCLNTYDRTRLEDFDYVSDSNYAFRRGCPSDMLRERTVRRVHLNLHPECWTAEEKSVVEKWRDVLVNNFNLVQGSMLARESSYTDRQAISLRTVDTVHKPKPT